jgi:hypothetical protein
MSSFPSLPERLKTIATESSFAAAYGPTEMIRLLDSDEPHQQKRLLLDTLRSHENALNPHSIEMDPRVEYALTQAEEYPAIKRDGRTPTYRRTPTYSRFISEFTCILRIAAEMDEKIQALASQNLTDRSAIEEGLFNILVESSRVVPDQPHTIQEDRALHAVELFVRHPESKGLMRGLGREGEQSLLGRINEVVFGNRDSQMSACLEIKGAFENLADMSRS